jgi:RimJ/RimL family protein N-acetyltransferase
MTAIETARLRLRTGHEGDVHAIVEALNDWSVAQWLVRPPFPYSQTDAQAFIAWTREHHTVFVIADRETDELIGCISLEPIGDRAEIGYWMRPSKQGRGYADEAVRSVLALAFEQMHLATVFGTVDPENERSRNLLLRNGFALVGRRDREVPNRRGARDSLFFVRFAPPPPKKSVLRPLPIGNRPTGSRREQILLGRPFGAPPLSM